MMSLPTADATADDPADDPAIPAILARAEAAFERGDFAHARRLARQLDTVIANDPAAVSEDQRTRARELAHKLGRDRTTLILGIAAFALLVAVCFAYLL